MVTQNLIAFYSFVSLTRGIAFYVILYHDINLALEIAMFSAPQLLSHVLGQILCPNIPLSTIFNDFTKAKQTFTLLPSADIKTIGHRIGTDFMRTATSLTKQDIDGSFDMIQKIVNTVILNGNINQS
jgi:hypothetical protein